MSFDLDPGEQAQISGGDFAQMCDEMKALKQSNTELLEALQPFANYACDPPCDCHNRIARAAIAKAKGETK